jgi:hypothetical protein
LGFLHFAEMTWFHSSNLLLLLLLLLLLFWWFELGFELWASCLVDRYSST